MPLIVQVQMGASFKFAREHSFGSVRFFTPHLCPRQKETLSPVVPSIIALLCIQAEFCKRCMPLTNHQHPPIVLAKTGYDHLRKFVFNWLHRRCIGRLGHSFKSMRLCLRSQYLLDASGIRFTWLTWPFMSQYCADCTMLNGCNLRFGSKKGGCNSCRKVRFI